MGIADDILMHYGMPRRSGRYPWGSGKEPYQHSADFIARVEELKAKGLKEAEISQALGLKTTELRVQMQLAKHERRETNRAKAITMREDGHTLDEIAKSLGLPNESSVRSLLDEKTAANTNKAKTTADILKKELETKGMIDVGAGAEIQLGVSKEKLKEALYILEREGYNVYGMGIPQVNNPGKQSNTTVLANPDVQYKDVYQKIGDIKEIGEYHSTDNGETFTKREYPASISSDRVAIRYGDQGGLNKDGVIEIRRGVADLNLGDSHYAQVRILVDGTHYLKGMAMYSDNIPKGHDIVFNTNKNSDTDKMKCLKEIKTDDPENPFGAYIKANGQSKYIDKDGKEKLSAINKLKEEGDWDKMSRNLSSQFLSKQPVELIKKQLDLTYADAVYKFDEINNLTNPTIKRKMLLDFADTCDGAVVHLKAAALPRQSTQVILPLDCMKPTEVYAPNYRQGEKVALVRYPHGGTFEIPILTVNNKNPKAIDILGQPKDAIGIHASVAERLSGADFDGDTVCVIPTNSRVKIKSTPALEGLKDFNPKEQYRERPGMTYMTKQNTQKQMGMVSNLITDMTLRGAPESEITRAIKHSMVVIDAAKHKLDYKQSEKDNGIRELKNKWQIRVDEDGSEKYGGASTLLSRRKQDERIPERKGSGVIDPNTGKIEYKTSGRKYIDKDGKEVLATQNVKRLSLIDDVRKLSSGTVQENAYADYANKMKMLANEARKAYKATGNLKYNPSAAITYKNEVKKLDASLRIAELNAPKERRAQAIANSIIKAQKQANPDIDKDELKKLSQRALEDARIKVGASGKNSKIHLSDSEWNAIQAGAITDTKLTKILRYTDSREVQERATPKRSKTLSQAQINKLNHMKASGYTASEIAESLGVSTSTVNKYAE